MKRTSLLVALVALSGLGWALSPARAAPPATDHRRTPREALENCAARIEGLDLAHPGEEATDEQRKRVEAANVTALRTAWEAQGIADRTESLYVVLSAGESAAWRRVLAVMQKHASLDALLSEEDRQR